MYTPIDYNLLNENKACGPQLDLIKKHFGLKPIPLTKEVVSNLSYLFDIDWIAKRFLTEKDFIKYKKAQYPAFKKYIKADDEALAQHEETTHLAWKEYDEVVDSNWANGGRSNSKAARKYNKAQDLANLHYNNKCKLARAEYRKVIALEFIKLYKKGMA